MMTMKPNSKALKEWSIAWKWKSLFNVHIPDIFVIFLKDTIVGSMLVLIMQIEW